MLSRLFLAAGVAALAIAAPASAKPGGGHGGQDKGGQQQAAPGGGGGGGNPHGNRGGGDGGGQRAVVQGGGGGHGHGGGGFAAPQQRVERQQSRGFERQQGRNVERQRGFERQQARNVERQRGFERQQQQSRNVERQRGFERQQARQQARNVERQRGFERRPAQQQARNVERFERQQARNIERQQVRGNREQLVQQQAFADRQFNGERLKGRGNLGGKQARFVDRQFVDQNWNATRFAALNYNDNFRVVPVNQVERFVGVPVGQVASFAALSPLPMSVQYLYPDTPDYYYRYGDGYLYQVNRGDNLIAALIPLLGGGYLPGQYLPQPYMQSYVPAAYGFNNFYPDYGNNCNRYYGGVIYEVDCYTGLVEDVIPMYAGGYGVGQLLPSAYNYYNVPMQYRSLYYDTPDYGYWYSPGAIYQYDQRSSMITSVASLLSPGFAIGQPLPAGYGVYNVPYDYRATYYDTPNAWYRYNNGYIYQVDPVSQLVTAIVASLLT